MQQQTMLALGALLILTTLTLNQQKSIFLVQRGAYVREIESAATDYAKIRLHQITEGLAFDEARIGMSVIDTGTNDLTLPLSLGTEGVEDATDKLTFDDIDDYNGFSETEAHTLSNETYFLRADYTVKYVNPVTADTSSAARTLAKQVIINVASVDSVGSATARVSFKKTVAISDFAS